MKEWRNIPRDMDFPRDRQKVLVWDEFKKDWIQARFIESHLRFRVGSIKALLQFNWWHPGPTSEPEDKK